MSSSSSSADDNQMEFKRIYEKILKSKQIKKGENQSEDGVKGGRKDRQHHRNKKDRYSQGSRRDNNKALDFNRNSRSRSRQKPEVSHVEQKKSWHVYSQCPLLQLTSKISKTILELPIFKKQRQILKAIIQNQFVLITGETGCGKSTQVPRLIFEYLRSIKDNSSKIMCIQPRRLAVINLQSILQKQMVEKNMIGYQIGMHSKIFASNRIVFVTNGIFLQRLVHSSQFFNEYPFIILDQVHERDIDTDFILLTIKRIIRQYPKVRIILMSATIDNNLFRYYFASDHIDNILTEENFYKKILKAKQERIDEKMINQEESASVKSQSEDYYEEHGFSFMKARFPCPVINVTEPGKYTRDFFYLDTVNTFLQGGTLNLKWGSVVFSEKYPSTYKQLYETSALIIDQIAYRHRKDTKKCSVLIFMPGLSQIQHLSQYIVSFIKSERISKEFQMIHVHSSILSNEILDKLHEAESSKMKIIIATNIAQSSITVLGVKYIIDFCLSKEVRFDLKSRMQNLDLVWASKASCNQRAGRTGRVCDGVIFRLVQQKFYEGLADYSRPQIQRSSLDKLILRIKLLHESNNNEIFADPGEVLGSAIQPPHLKNIDTALKSLQFCGGIRFKQDQFYLTDLGKLYIDIPIDITYCKLLVMSKLFGTYDDILILVSILSQSKNAVRKINIERNYTQYYQIMENSQACDFYALIGLYKRTKENFSKRNVDYRTSINLEIFHEVKDMIYDINKRMDKKRIESCLIIGEEEERQWRKEYDYLCKKIFNSDKEQQAMFRFKLTIICGFIQNILKVRQASFDDKQEKRIALIKKMGINLKNTICILGSNIIKRSQSSEGDEKLVNIWKAHIERAFKIKNIDFTLTYGISYLHFKNQKDLQKFIFYKHIEENKKTFSQMNAVKGDKNYLSIGEILKCFGEMDHMHSGRPVTFYKEQNVFVDNFSLNRIINLNEGDDYKYLIANNIAKQSSRMIVRYTSLLPSNIKFLEIISHLLFYPFVVLLPSKNGSRYESIYLKKKSKIPITYNLTAEEISKANKIRSMIKAFLSLKQKQENFFSFQLLMLQFIYFKRHEVVEQERWQTTYMNQLFAQRPQLKKQYDQTLQQANERLAQKQKDRGIDLQLMNEIKVLKLRHSFFSDIQVGNESLEDRRKKYNDWKLIKLRQVRELQMRAINHDSYIACAQDSCGLKLAKLNRIGPISKEKVYRQLFEIEENNIIKAEMEEMNNHFCTLLMSNQVDSSYELFACKNNHHFGIRLQGEKKIKILPFSYLMIIYPDGSAQQADFQRLDMRYWKKTHDERLKEKYRLKITAVCFVCDQEFMSLKDLQNHIKEKRHTDNVHEFSKSLRIVQNPKTVDKVGVDAKNEVFEY